MDLSRAMKNVSTNLGEFGQHEGVGKMGDMKKMSAFWGVKPRELNPKGVTENVDVLGEEGNKILEASDTASKDLAEKGNVWLGNLQANAERQAEFFGVRPKKKRLP